MTTKPSTEDQQQLQQRCTGAYAEFKKKRQKAAKAAYLQMRHNLIEHAIQERKRDIESRTVTLKDGRMAILPRRSNDALINLLDIVSKMDRD